MADPIPRSPDPADTRVVHVTLELGRPQPLSFGDGSVRVYKSERVEDLDPRLTLGMTTARFLKDTPLLATEGELRDKILDTNAKLHEEFLVRLTAFRVVFPQFFYSPAY